MAVTSAWAVGSFDEVTSFQPLGQDLPVAHDHRAEGAAPAGLHVGARERHGAGEEAAVGVAVGHGAGPAEGVERSPESARSRAWRELGPRWRWR